jgi:hypothetical protein
MDPKLTMLFLLIGTIIGLSHVSVEALANTEREKHRKRWRNILQSRNKS